MGASLKSLSQLSQQPDARPYFLVKRNQELHPKNLACPSLTRRRFTHHSVLGGLFIGSIDQSHRASRPLA